MPTSDCRLSVVFYKRRLVEVPNGGAGEDLAVVAKLVLYVMDIRRVAPPAHLVPMLLLIGLRLSVLRRLNAVLVLVVLLVDVAAGAVNPAKVRIFRDLLLRKRL